MSNPFDYLRERSLAEEAKRRQEDEARELATAERKKQELQRAEYQSNLRNQYSEMVIKVLGQLKEMLYPSSELRGWIIGYTSSHFDSETRSHNEYWHSLVSVKLVFENNKSFFECETEQFQANDGSRTKKCSLLEKDLITTLQQLHEKHYKAR